MMAIQYTPSLGLPYPEVTDAPLIASRDLRALAQKMDSEGAQIRGESTAALTAGQAAEALATQALSRAQSIEEPIYTGTGEPEPDQDLRVNWDADAPGDGVTSEDITDASTVGRAILTAPLSVDARNALAIFTGTRALLDAGTDTAERTWDAKELSEYVTDQVAEGGGAASWDDLTGKPSTFPPSAHTHAVADVTGLQAQLDALAYESGERAITSLIRPGYTVERATLQRVGRSVTLTFEGLTPSSDGAGFPFNAATIPAGFRPPSERPFLAAAVNGVACRMAVRPLYGVGIYGATAGTPYYGTVTYLVPSALPTALPGV